MLCISEDMKEKLRGVYQSVVINIKSFFFKKKTILKLKKMKNRVGSNFYWLRKQLAIPFFAYFFWKLLIWLTLLKFSCLWNRSCKITRYFIKPTKSTTVLDQLTKRVSVDSNISCACSAPQWIWLQSALLRIEMEELWVTEDLLCVFV